MTDREMVESWLNQLFADSTVRFEREYNNVRIAGRMLADMDERERGPHSDLACIDGEEAEPHDATVY